MKRRNGESGNRRHGEAKKRRIGEAEKRGIGESICLRFRELPFSVSENSHSPLQIERTPIKNFILYWLPLIIYCAAIFIQSSFPATGQYPVFFFDKILHFTAYALLGILFFRALSTLALRKRPWLTVLLSIIAASVYGLSDEIHQYFVPLRDADMLDWLADVIGSICGVLLYLTIIRNIRRPI